MCRLLAVGPTCCRHVGNFPSQAPHCRTDQAEEGVVQAASGVASSHPSYSSSVAVAAPVNIAAADVVPSRVFVVAASVGSVAPDGGSGSAAGAIVDDNANGGHGAVATATGPDVGVGGGTSTDRDNDDHGVNGNRAVVMMMIAGERGGEATARR
jgi:hypothetical protein